MITWFGSAITSPRTACDTRRRGSGTSPATIQRRIEMRGRCRLRAVSLRVRIALAE